MSTVNSFKDRGWSLHPKVDPYEAERRSGPPSPARPADGKWAFAGSPEPAGSATYASGPVLGGGVSPGARLSTSDGPQRSTSPTVQKRTVRQVEVPFTRQVKVPVKTSKVQTVHKPKRVQTTRLVEEPAFEWVDEEYLEEEQQEAVRDKIVWVKQVVPEKYLKTVHVKKTRRVKVPTTRIREVSEWVTVNVPEDELVEQDAYRIDTVQDVKVVEVEETQEYELRPVPTGRRTVSTVRDLGRVRGAPHIVRNVGHDVLDYDPAVSEDSYDMTQQYNSGLSREVYEQHEYQQQHQQQYQYQEQQKGLELSYRSTDSAAHTSMLGIVVKRARVPPGADPFVYIDHVRSDLPAWRAGIREGDIILTVDSVAVSTLDQFRHAMRAAGDPLELAVRRSGAFRHFTIHRGEAYWQK